MRNNPLDIFDEIINIGWISYFDLNVLICAVFLDSGPIFPPLFLS